MRTPTLEKHRDLQVNESRYVKLATSILKQYSLLGETVRASLLSMAIQSEGIELYFNMLSLI